MPTTTKEVIPVAQGATVAKRRPPAAGMGRVRGSLNKTTAALKGAILEAATLTGKDGKGKDGLIGYCQHLASNEPRAFAALLGKVLPMQMVDEQGRNMLPTRIIVTVVNNVRADTQS